LNDDERLWLALLTFERCAEGQDILPDWAHGACGWLLALAPDEEAARQVLIRDLENAGLRVLRIDKLREAFGEDDVEEVDDHLASNFRDIESGKQTVWGTIYGYSGEGEA